MELMWRYKLDEARQVLEPFRKTSPWHACAYAECAALSVVITGRRSEAQVALDLLGAAESLPWEGSTPGSRAGGQAHETFVRVAQEVLSAEMLLIRCILQVVAGMQLRALYNLRRCWMAYRSLQQHLRPPGLQPSVDSVEPLTHEEMISRINFGLGFFYLLTSVVPESIRRLVYLAGFVSDAARGNAHLETVAGRPSSVRAPLAALLLAINHMDRDPDVDVTAELLKASVLVWGDNVLLHWASSLVAWRHCVLSDAKMMLNCALRPLGPDVAAKAVYLRYELGLIEFLTLNWSAAYANLRAVHLMIARDAPEKVFLPYMAVVALQLAAVCFQCDKDAEGEQLLQECAARDYWTNALMPQGMLQLEVDFNRLVQVFLKHRVSDRRMMAFEIMYFMRQVSRIESDKMHELRGRVRWAAGLGGPGAYGASGADGNDAGAPAPAALSARSSWSSRAPPSGGGAAALARAEVMRRASGLMLECVCLFFLGLPDEAAKPAAQFVDLQSRIPSCCTYLTVHGLYWCGRIFAILGRSKEAIACLRKAKAYKKYPFNIAVKLNTVLESVKQTQLPPGKTQM
eukprot:TRINITY_DN26001_c0_g1_i1.p1 TRINITY_DN26001_c0_g1~~TRINITY_DN26001_c0_g1_i1.p1  ORF type:complete len:624 (+),score=139.52 TRINITY_DN26001_c0_g1_i1:158-1873(+)